MRVKILIIQLLNIIIQNYFTLLSTALLSIYHLLFLHELGSDAVRWFAVNMEGIKTMEEAQAVGQRLIEIGLISEIQGMLRIHLLKQPLSFLYIKVVISL